MKKKVFITIILCLVLSVSLMACAKEKPFEIKDISSGRNSDAVNTLLLTDIRFDGSEADVIREKMIKKMIADKKYNEPTNSYEFIAIAGNIVNAQENGKVMKKAVKFIDGLGIPWAVALGELDVKGDTSKEEIMDILTDSSLKNSMVMRGASYKNNYYIKMVKENGDLLNIMYFVDTSVPCDDGFVEWYKNTVKNVSYKYSETQGDMINSHIVLNKAVFNFLENDKDEQITLWENGTKLREAIYELKSTKSVLFGYDTRSYYDYSLIEDCRYAYIRSMGFDSAMGKSGDKDRDKVFERQANYVGASWYDFNNGSYMSTLQHLTEYNPKNIK